MVDRRRLFRSTISVGLCAAALSLVVGCAQQRIEPLPICDITKQSVRSQVSGPIIVSAFPGAISDMPLNAVNISDTRIIHKVLVQATNAKRLETGGIQVWTRLVNCTDFPLQVEGRTHFLDEKQTEVEPVSAWQRVMLPARTFNIYSEKSTATKEAASYLIEIREGK